jgi:hypothetical protein
MSVHAEEIKLLDSVYSSFPEVAKDLDFTLKEMWDYEPHQRNEAWTMLIERFSQLTTDAIRRGDERTAKIYLDYMAEQYNRGGENCKKAIDTYYVESLLWDIKDLKIKKWGWSLIPAIFKDLYIKMWGEPSFKK